MRNGWSPRKAEQQERGKMNYKGKFIYYDGRYWLIEEYEADLYEGAFFAG